MTELDAASTRPPVVSTSTASAITHTLELLVDLADSLATQTERLRKQAATATAGSHENELTSLTSEIEAVRARCDALTLALGAAEAAAKVPMRTSEVPEPEGAESPVAPDDAEGAERLALELKLAGSPAEDVQRTLEETLGRDDAAEIVDRVFRFRRS
jgi:hypothetical protein